MAVCGEMPKWWGGDDRAVIGGELWLGRLDVAVHLQSVARSYSCIISRGEV